MHPLLDENDLQMFWPRPLRLRRTVEAFLNSLGTLYLTFHDHQIFEVIFLKGWGEWQSQSSYGACCIVTPGNLIVFNRCRVWKEMPIFLDILNNSRCFFAFVSSRNYSVDHIKNGWFLRNLVVIYAIAVSLTGQENCVCSRIYKRAKHVRGG